MGSLAEREAMKQYVIELQDLVTTIPLNEDTEAFFSIFKEKFQLEGGFDTLERSQDCVEVIEAKRDPDSEEFCDTLSKPEETKEGVTPELEHCLGEF